MAKRGWACRLLENRGVHVIKEAKAVLADQGNGGHGAISPFGRNDGMALMQMARRPPCRRLSVLPMK